MQEQPPVEPFDLPHDFLLGTATASLQIEGGDTNNSWYRWAEAGHVHDGSHSLVACDHWNRVEQDVKLIASLGGNAYRLSLEWSRIEPEEGRWDLAALDHYRRELELLRSVGVRPVVTLHHFSNPLWFEDDDAWMNDRAPERFRRYARRAVEYLGDLVSDWITINEPNVYLILGYAYGLWPPGERSVRRVLRGARNMVRAHALAYLDIHERSAATGRGEPRVGVAHHLRVFDPEHGLLDRMSAALLRRMSQEIFVEAMTTGRSLAPLGRLDLPAERGPRSRLADFLGINYYTRDTVRFTPAPGQLFAERFVPEGAPVNDLGWEIYPAGLFRVLTEYWERYRLPLIVTENGTCDRQDAFRPRYLAEHLAQAVRAREAGADVRGYLHWSLMDNFEWVEGVSARFGLYKVDYGTQRRTLRRSGALFADIARRGGLDGDLITRYRLDEPYSV